MLMKVAQVYNPIQDISIEGLEKKLYEKMFPQERVTNGGFEKATHFFKAALAGMSKDMSELIPSEGGFLVPTSYTQYYLDMALDQEIVRPRAQVFPIPQGPSLQVSSFEIGDHSSNLYGGVIGYWGEEGGTMSRSAPKARLVNLALNKLYILCRITNEMLEDWPGSEDRLNTALSSALAWFQDYAYLRGSGAGEPLGVLNGPSTYTTAAEDGQSATTINYTNLTNMLSHLAPGSWRNAIWVAHPTTIPQLLTLSVVVGSGGSYVPVLNRTLNSWEIFGKPVIFTEKLPTLGTEGDILLADFSQYAIGMKSGMRFDRNTGGDIFRTDQTELRLVLRTDGQPFWGETLTLKDGSHEVSPFVTLATRS